MTVIFSALDKQTNLMIFVNTIIMNYVESIAQKL